MADYLDLVALGTVADVVPLDQNNRILVKQGLQRMRAGQCRPGILALLKIAKRDHRYVQAADLGFAVGPRLNAAGRLDDMSLGIACLLAEQPEQAAALAQQLDDLNTQRRQIEQTMQDQALTWLAGYAPQVADLPWGLSLYQPDWHQGVIGILASRLKERYHRPVIAFAIGSAGTLKGSARSIPGLPIRDLLDTIATQQPTLLQKFGGHAMAAGLVIQAADLGKFSDAFDTAVRATLTIDDLQAKLLSDGTIAAELLTLSTAQALQDTGPWGQAFPEPLFEGEFEVREQRVVGEKHWKLVLGHSVGEVDAIAFNAVTNFSILPRYIKVAYHLDVNVWRDQARLQLRVVKIQI
jgi:single-stranded-DNA-specific exonuclease